MPWRVHFTPDDLDRVEIGATPGPLAETIFALSLLRWPARPRGILSQWPDQVKHRLTPRIRPLATLIPPGNRGVDLFTLIGDATTIDQGITSLMNVPDDALAAEVDYFDRNWQRLPADAWTAADSTGHGRIALVDAAVAAYGALVAPYWAAILAQLRAEQAVRSRILANRGGSGLLASIQSRWIRWCPPVLEVDTPSLQGLQPGPLHLRGRGLRLIPSMFTGDYPSLHMSLQDLTAAPTLLFAATSADAPPVQRQPPADDQVNGPLASLLGRTRAVALASIGEGCTTTELAAKIGTSVAGASQHATVLREAGLIITSRTGGAVLHTLTPLGSELLTVGATPD